MKRTRQQLREELENEVAKLKSRLATVESENGELQGALMKSKDDYNRFVSGQGVLKLKSVK